MFLRKKHWLFFYVKKFDTILDRVKNVDVNYANRFNKIYENMILYNKKIVNVANMISPEGITVNSDIYNGVINKFNEIYSDKKIDYLQSDLDDLENEMPVIRDIPWYEKALNGVGGTLVSLARDNIEGIAFIPYGIVDLIFGSNLNYNLSQKLDNAEEYLINNVVADKQSYYYGKAVGNAICVAEGIICTIAGAIILVGGVTISAVGTAASATGAGIVVGGVAIAISVPVVAVGTAITAVGGNMLLSSADNFKENIAKANKVKVEVDDLKQKEDIKKLDDGIKQAKKDISKIDEGISKAGKNITDIINKNGLTVDKFNELRVKDVALLTDSEKLAMKSIRDSLSMPDNMTTMQKVIPNNDISKYLDGSYTQVGGYVTKYDDVSNLTKYDDIYESLRLDYPGTAYKIDADSSLGVIRFKTPNAEKFEIPYGVDFGGTITDAPPFTGNGFTKAMNDNIIPEYKCNSFLDVYDGAELYQIDKNGIETLIAVFNEIDGKFMPIK